MKKGLLLVALITTSLVGLASTAFFLVAPKVCVIDPIESIASPSGSFRIDVQFRSCGMSAPKLEVLLLEVGAREEVYDVLYSEIAETNNSRAGNPRVGVVWSGNEAVRLRVPKGGAKKARSALDKVDVTYEDI